MIKFLHAFCTARPTHTPRVTRWARRGLGLLGSSRCAKRRACCALILLYFCGGDGGLDPSQKAFGARSSCRAPQTDRSYQSSGQRHCHAYRRPGNCSSSARGRDAGAWRDPWSASRSARRAQGSDRYRGRPYHLRLTPLPKPHSRERQPACHADARCRRDLRR